MSYNLEGNSSSLSYFNYLENCFQKATKNSKDVESKSFLIAQKPFIIIASNVVLLQLIYKAFSHLPYIEMNENSLKVMVWEEHQQEVSFLLPIEISKDLENYEVPIEYYFETHAYILSERGNVFYAYDYKANRAFVCIKDVDLLPNYFLAAPLFRIIKIWAKRNSLSILHAGCVGNDQSSVIFVGKGGMGKSTTSLQCLLDGLYYLGDDYIIVEKINNTAFAYSLYCSGKLHTTQLNLFPEFKKKSIYRRNNLSHDKPLLYLNDIFESKICYKRPIKAILAPHITTNTESRLTSMSAFEALKSLAPSTLIQLNLGDQGDFAKMAELTRQLPCYKLELGSDLSKITHVVNSLLLSFDE